MGGVGFKNAPQESALWIELHGVEGENKAVCLNLQDLRPDSVGQRRNTRDRLYPSSDAFFVPRPGTHTICRAPSSDLPLHKLTNTLLPETAVPV